MTTFGFGAFGFGVRRPYEMIIKKGENVLISEWSWKKLGFIRKLVQLDSEGNLTVKKL